jgi:hypothetical protein
MVPMIPSEILTGGYELICCACTAMAAICSYLLLLR